MLLCGSETNGTHRASRADAVTSEANMQYESPFPNNDAGTRPASYADRFPARPGTTGNPVKPAKGGAQVQRDPYDPPRYWDYFPGTD